jgi:pimeloyl-ACP methyl ester carboxylesterase
VFDWDGRAACIVAALWPERVTGLVAVDEYNIQNIAASPEPAPPAHEKTYWYQFYLQSERGRRGLEANRDELCGMLWRDWSPTWWSCTRTGTGTGSAAMFRSSRRG